MTIHHHASCFAQGGLHDGDRFAVVPRAAAGRLTLRVATLRHVHQTSDTTDGTLQRALRPGSLYEAKAVQACRHQPFSSV